MNVPTEVRDIPLDQIRVVFRRSRKRAEFEEMKASMADPKIGLRFPIHVKDLGKVEKDGKRYVLIVGEGRVTAAEELKWKTIPALIVQAESVEFAGRFLAENMIRTALPWAQKGRIIRDEVKGGKSLKEVAEALHITEGNARKYLRVLDKGSTAGFEDEVAAMPMNEAEVFTALPAKGQKIVMEVATESKVPIAELSAMARKIEKETGAGWTKAALQKEITRFDDELTATRKRLKVLRLHHSLGPQNIRQLIKSPDFLKAATAEKLNLSHFQ